MVRMLTVLVLLLALGLPAQAAPSYPPLFGSAETPSQNLRLFTKWTGVLERHAVEKKLEDTPCSEGPFNKCFLQKWKHYLGEIQSYSALDKLREVNRFANYAPYITDPVNYGVADYWATPRQFLSKDGDCEDYAITKFYSLLTLGIPGDQMRVVVLNDLNLRIAHAVLVVYVDGVAWLLDNQIRDVVRADTVRHYRAIYSVNETTWWLHRY
jgi:predicted transglutaminase-like cysteine proteinase